MGTEARALLSPTMILSNNVMFSLAILAAMAATCKANTDLQVGQSTLSTCSPACSAGQCCLKKDNAVQATCQPLALSGQACSGGYSSSPPSLTQAISAQHCPCTAGSMCF